MINISDKKNCCGCSACKNICPVNAIIMVDDEEGFSYPKINSEKCINCGLCETVCPFINSKINQKTKVVYSAHTKNKELLLASSSGGVFGELAKSIIANKGKVIGVNNKYDYVMVDSIDELPELFGSKYVQAKPGEIFKIAKAELDGNTLVLFSGNPCLINGLKLYLKKDYENLITCDFICHGVPSQKLLKNYCKSFKHDIKKINFREKSTGWHNYSTEIFLEKVKHKSLAIDNEYMQSFFNNISLRLSCYDCKVKGKKRKSDITLGDYWGIDENSKTYDFNGNSIIVINTNKGEELFDDVKENLIYEEVKEKELEKNSSYSMSSNKPIERDVFYKDLNKYGFKKVSKKYKLKPKFIRRLKIKLKNILKG